MSAKRERDETSNFGEKKQRLNETEEVADLEKSDDAKNKKNRYVMDCKLCYGTFHRDNVHEVVTGIGSALSDDFPYPQQKSYTVTLCNNCCRGHGCLIKCIACKEWVIGQTIDGKCRTCFSDEDILALLNKYSLLNMVKQKWADYSGWEWGKDDEKNLIWYQVFFEEDGENANPAMEYLNLALWLGRTDEERAQMHNDKKMKELVRALMTRLASVLTKRGLLRYVKKRWADDWDDQYRDKHTWAEIFFEDDRSMAAEAMKYVDLMLWLELPEKVRNKRADASKMQAFIKNLKI